MTPPRGPKRAKERDSYPPRFHTKGRAVYHVTGTKPQKWTKIGTIDDMPAAITAWGKIEYSHAPISDGTVRAVATKFLGLLDDPANPLKLAETTRRNYKLMLRIEPPSTLILAFGKMLMADVRKHHIADYLDASPHPVAANRQIQLFSKMFQYCERKGMAGVEANPCYKLERNHESARSVYVDDALYCAIWTCAWNSDAWKRYAAAMDISLITGWREGEILRIRETDFDADELRGSESKDKAKRMRLPMFPALAAALQRALDVRAETPGGVPMICKSLFTGRQGAQLTDGGFKSGWGRMMRAAVADKTITAEQRFHFHDIRAKHASDRDDDLAQLALGHTSARMTAVYMRNPKGRKYDGLDSPAVGGGTTKKDEK